jgi:hypothetical protein
MSTEEKEGKQRNEEIENQLKRDKMMQRNEIKMLLLGQLPRAHPESPPSNAMQVPVNPASRQFSSR